VKGDPSTLASTDVTLPSGSTAEPWSRSPAPSIDPEVEEVSYTETMLNGFPASQTAERFGSEY